MSSNEEEVARYRVMHLWDEHGMAGVLAMVRDVHAMNENGRCDNCIESLSSDEWREVEWPCETAEIVYQSHEITAQVETHQRLKREAWEAHCDATRLKMDTQADLAPQAYWLDVQYEARLWVGRERWRRMMRPMYDAMMAPMLRFEQFATDNAAYTREHLGAAAWHDPKLDK